MKLKDLIFIAETNSFSILKKLLLPVAKIKELEKFVEDSKVNLEIAEQERKELVKKYGYEVNEGMYQVLPHNIDRYTQEYKQVINQDIQCDFMLDNIITDDMYMTTEQYSAIKILWSGNGRKDN